MSAVLVTGATTPIGQALITALAAKPEYDSIIAVVEPRRPLPAPMKRVRFVPADLTRSRDLRELMFGHARDARVEVVVHAAHHRAAQDEGHRIHALNVESTRELLALSERHPTVRRFIFRSHADVYQARPERPSIFLEDHPLELAPGPQWLRDRVEADLVVGLRMGMTDRNLVILRAAECLAPDSGSQLFDYLRSKVCFTPLGFDPMLNLVSIADLVDATLRAIQRPVRGIFNVPGFDTLPLSSVIRKAGRVPFPVPSPFLHALYGARALTRGTDFRYDQNAVRFHFGGVLDGSRAREILGYRPRRPVDFDAPARFGLTLRALMSASRPSPSDPSPQPAGPSASRA
jgi:UDP-glucose 4-epimerase